MTCALTLEWSFDRMLNLCMILDLSFALYLPARALTVAMGKPDRMAVHAAGSEACVGRIHAKRCQGLRSHANLDLVTRGRQDTQRFSRILTYICFFLSRCVCRPLALLHAASF